MVTTAAHRSGRAAFPSSWITAADVMQAYGSASQEVALARHPLPPIFE